MKKNILFLAILFLMLAMSFSAQAAVLNFDSFGSDVSLYGTNYGGFTWDTNIHTYSQDDYNNSYDNTVTFPSSPIAAFNGFGTETVSIANITNFDFDGAYFTGWSGYDTNQDYTATSITMNGYRNGSLVGSVFYDLSNSFVYAQAKLFNIDRLDLVSSDSLKWWLMDNFTYSEHVDNVVPEPASMLLFATGLAGAVLRKKFVG